MINISFLFLYLPPLLVKVFESNICPSLFHCCFHGQVSPTLIDFGLKCKTIHLVTCFLKHAILFFKNLLVVTQCASSAVLNHVVVFCNHFAYTVRQGLISFNFINPSQSHVAHIFIDSRELRTFVFRIMHKREGGK